MFEKNLTREPTANYLGIYEDVLQYERVCEDMPELSRFLGMVISICFDDHNPPHFHVEYGGKKALISISDSSILRGSLPPRVLGLVMEWARLHEAELMENWNMIKESGKHFKIEPLT